VIPINLPTLFQSPYKSQDTPIACCCPGGGAQVNVQINPDAGFLANTIMGRTEQAAKLLQYARENGFIVFQGS
jgi:hypothetical protein